MGKATGFLEYDRHDTKILGFQKRKGSQALKNSTTI